MPWVERVGAMHVHSRYSDGRATIPELLAAAREAGLAFLVLSDHDSLAAAREGWQGVHGGIALLVAAEITPRRHGHVLGMKVRTCAGYANQESALTLDAIARQGGYAFIAHPMGKHKPALRIRHAPWQDWRHPAIRGLEIWSYMHDWVEEVAWWRLPLAYTFWKHPDSRLRRPDPEILRRWDEVGQSQRLAGFAGLDAHGYQLPLTRAQIFPYPSLFRAMRNHLIVRSEDWERDAVAAVWDAIEQGRGFVSHDFLTDAAGTQCEARLPNGRALQMGEEAAFESGTVTTLRLPRRAQIRWKADGRTRLCVDSDVLEARPAGPGVYRFEAYLNGRPWLFANPLYLRERPPSSRAPHISQNPA